MATWQYKKIPEFTGGINRSNRSDILQENEVISTINLIPDQNSLTIAKGYSLQTTFLSTGLVSSIAENIKLFHIFETAAGVTVPLMFTDIGAYSFDGTDWNQVQNASSATNTYTNATNLINATAHPLIDNDLIKLVTTGTLPVELSNAVVYHVINANANDFQISLTLGGSAVSFTDDGSGTHSFIPAFNGGTTAAIKATTYTPSDSVIWTNGVDPVQIYEQSTLAIRPLGGLTGGAPLGVTSAVNTCREVATWDTRVVLLNTTEDGNELPQQIRWSDVANIEDFTGTGISDAGFERLSDKEDSILSANILQQNLVIYRSNSIVRGVRVGSISRTFKFTEIISTEGAFGPNAVTELVDSHMFIGNNNIYIYKGGQSLETIGDKVYPLVFSPSGILDFTKSTTVLAKYIRTLRQTWFCLWQGTLADSNGDFTAYKTAVLVLDIEKQSWGIREFGTDTNDVRIETISELAITNDPAWEDTELTWLEIGEGVWNAQTFDAGYPNILIGTKHFIFNQDHFEAQDDAVPIPFNIETKDFLASSNFIRFEYIEFETNGGVATASYSIDRGNTWILIGDTTSRVSVGVSRLYFSTVTKQIRFRLVGTGGGFTLNSMAFNFIDESEF